MVNSQAKRARKQVDSEVFERADNCEALALESGIALVRGGKLLGEERDRALDSCGVALKQDCTDYDF